jgi:hypothetical protein
MKKTHCPSQQAQMVQTQIMSLLSSRSTEIMFYAQNKNMSLIFFFLKFISGRRTLMQKVHNLEEFCNTNVGFVYLS